MGFFDKVEARISSNSTILCLGLDPRDEQVEKFSKTAEFERLFQLNVDKKENWYKLDKNSTYVKLKLYCLHILDNTLDHVCCVKPNLAFFLSRLTDGVQVLVELCNYLRELNVPVLLDCKLGDIGTTTEYYKKFVFEELRADSCTVNTLLGSDVLKSFCSDSSNNFVNDLFVLAKCSNESSQEFQSALLKDGTPLYLRVIQQSEKFLENNSCNCKFGYVVGSNCVDEIRRIRESYECYLLVPGIGSQGGDLEQTLRYGLNKNKGGLIVPISRSITDTDVCLKFLIVFQDPNKSAVYYKNLINKYIK
ncbi:orotidine 5'-phosphate decarboxylase, putative [Theileria annulata]|uniref:Orotidine 5'-phosphate decarboxylase n=1 Tax=Theileria annulata TaxID=5874 RepID=Q4UIX7_THEAN|nr:orotidine 5'-phosphate decarboxylase, putative [Theileria annulata]CAI72962.1 orotidine 5'-phosphate decarboxylase, putative [Theileria annulata]|eukprot:XP_953640.1 orotidine 5'-phosphate decarboxylase, putative [Theileria annulata]